MGRRRVRLVKVPAIIRRGPGFIPVERGGQANDGSRFCYPGGFVIQEIGVMIEVPRGVDRAVMWLAICAMRATARRGECVALDALPHGWTWRAIRGFAVRGVG